MQSRRNHLAGWVVSFLPPEYGQAGLGMIGAIYTGRLDDYHAILNTLRPHFPATMKDAMKGFPA